MKLKEIAILMLLYPNIALANDGAMSIGKIGKRTYAMFECAQLASVGRSMEESVSITDKAFILGKRYLASVQRGELSEADVDESGFIYVLAKGPAPSIEFQLGRISQFAGNAALEEVRTSKWEEVKTWAKHEFDNRNCSLFLD